MWRFSSSILALIVVVTAAVLVTRVIGGLRPSPVTILFTNPDNSPCTLPCLFGLRPGETTTEEALRLLSTHPVTRSFTVTSTKPYILESAEAGGSSIAFSVTQDGFVDAVMLSANPGSSAPGTALPAFLPELISVGEFVGAFGAPDKILTSHWKTRSRIYFSFPSPMVWVQGRTSNYGMLSTDRINQDDSIIAVAVFGVHDCPRDKIKLLTRSWQGFTSKWRYDQGKSLDVAVRLVIFSDNPGPCLVAVAP